jgi:hypothetical protein
MEKEKKQDLKKIKKDEFDSLLKRILNAEPPPKKKPTQKQEKR